MAVYKAECTVLLRLKEIETSTNLLVTVEAGHHAEALPKAQAKAMGLARINFHDWKAKVARVTVINLVRVG